MREQTKNEHFQTSHLQLQRTEENIERSTLNIE